MIGRGVHRLVLRGRDQVLSVARGRGTVTLSVHTTRGARNSVDGPSQIMIGRGGETQIVLPVGKVVGHNRPSANAVRPLTKKTSSHTDE